MANEYFVNSADLTSVANAIRSKGETSAQLVFPSGFVTAIEGIKGGGDLNFEVVGSTVQPSNPVENSIWVNTDQEITSWMFSAFEPENAKSGMVWFRVGFASITEFNALKENSIQVYPYEAKQYVTGAWEPVSAKTFQNGEWKEWWDGTLYADGNMYTHITGGWTARAITGNTNYTGTIPGISLSTGIVTVSMSSAQGAGWKGGLYSTVNKIDLTDYDTLVFKGYCDPGDQYSNAYVVVCPDLAVWAGYPQVLLTRENKEYILPIEDCDGEYYIGIGVLSSNAYVHAYMQSLKLI